MDHCIRHGLCRPHLGLLLSEVSPSYIPYLAIPDPRRTYTRVNPPKMDIYDSAYPAHVWLMIFYGFLDSMWQTYAYWLMGAMSNDMAKLAVFTGFCKLSSYFNTALVIG